MTTSPTEAPRLKIWNAALSLFAQNGYAATGVQQIVENAGVTKPTLYYYYGSKAELFEQIVESAFSERRRVMEEAVGKEGNAGEQLKAMCEALVEFARRHCDLMRICYATTFAAPGELPEGMESIRRGERNFRYIMGVIEAGIARGELRNDFSAQEMALSISSQYFIMSIIAVMTPEGDTEDGAGRLVDLFLKGALPPTPN